MGNNLYRYHSWKCKTPGSVVEAYRDAKKKGWAFFFVMKIKDGYVLQMRKKAEA